MEGVVFSLRDGLETMRGIGVEPTQILAIGGGAMSALWLRLQADVYGVPVRRVPVEEGAAYGAALLGHVAAATFGSVQEAVDVVRTAEETIDPDLRTSHVYEALYEVFRGLYGALREDMHGLAGLT